MFGMAAELVNAQFCACSGNRCNGPEIDAMIENLGVDGNDGVLPTPHKVAALTIPLLTLKLFHY